jgi:hypothetical protein
MSNQSKKNIVQVTAFLRGTLQGTVWAKALLKQLFNAVGDVMALGQIRANCCHLMESEVMMRGSSQKPAAMVRFVEWQSKYAYCRCLKK